MVTQNDREKTDMAQLTGSNRILTTHVGSLPRPEAVLIPMLAKAKGEAYDAVALKAALEQGVTDIVKKQVEIGIDLVSDGELSKPSYATYVTERLSGFGGTSKGHVARDLKDFPDYARHLIQIGGVVPRGGGACCQGPVAMKNREPLDEDIAHMKKAVAAAKPTGAFLNSASPGVVAVFQQNEHYPSEEAYVEAVAEALRPEYEAIVEAGFALQLDAPDLAMSRHVNYNDMDDERFVKIVARNVEALNHATRNIPADKLRMHVCWGNYQGPHHRDIALDKILPEIAKAKPHMLLIEGANPRHAHEWAVFERIPVGRDKVLAPGVIDSTSNYIEHPELIAQRIEAYARIVGKERVVASTDCGFATFNNTPTVFPDITWRKLAALVEGAAIASKRA
jgi:5-methyltetrahydropteroyltriglutamate--homocysteine methyltransferase